MTYTINGSTISDSANLTFDVGGDIVLDADGFDLKFKNDGTEILRICSSSNNAVIRPVVDAKDLNFQQRDGTEINFRCEMTDQILVLIP